MGRRLAALALAAAVGSGVAAADHPTLPNWPGLLPPSAGGTGTGQPCGPDPTEACVDGVIAQMTAAWEPLDDACHPRAVFALTYLRTTEAFREALDDDPFADEPWIVQLDRVFADLYFDAVELQATGDAPPAWEIALGAADAGNTTGGLDVLLGMNAHIQRDLPFALEAAGLSGAGGSHKPDHDRVNEVLAAIVDPLQDELAQRYDPSFASTDASPSPADESGIMEMIKGWREGAWRNAERLASAGSPQERAALEASIEANAEAWARAFAAGDFSFYEQTRRAYCEAQQ